MEWKIISYAKSSVIFPHALCHAFFFIILAIRGVQTFFFTLFDRRISFLQLSTIPSTKTKSILDPSFNMKNTSTYNNLKKEITKLILQKLKDQDSYVDVEKLYDIL